MNIFGRYKSKAIMLIVLKALLAAIGLGLLVFGILLLLLKHELIANAIFPTLFGALSCLICFTITFLLLRGNDKKLAKELDTQLKLKEKVQTMLVYKDEQGAIYELQRQDAKKSLKEAKGKRFGLKHLWIYALCAVVGIAMLVVALVINPVKPEPEPEPEIPFELTTMQEAALVELIDYVEKSEMVEPYKTSVKNAVNDLITGLKLSTTVKERDICIKAANDTILKETDDSSLAIELINELWACNTPTLKALAKALNYYDWPYLDEWDKYSSSVADFRKLFIFTQVAKNDEGEGTEVNELEMIEYVRPLLEETSTHILSSLEKSGLDENDELYLILVRLASANEVDDKLGTKTLGLKMLSELITIVGYTETQRSLDDTLLAYNSIIFKALSAHKVNTDTGEYAVTRICNLFGYKAPAFERPRLINSSIEGEGGNEEAGGGGGAIGGGAVFGSDDLVYDPNTGEYVEYGEILARYYAIMYGKVDAGVYTEEEKAALEKYFAILQDGFPEEKEEGENENE